MRCPRITLEDWQMCDLHNLKSSCKHGGHLQYFGEHEYDQAVLQRAIDIGMQMSHVRNTRSS